MSHFVEADNSVLDAFLVNEAVKLARRDSEFDAWVATFEKFAWFDLGCARCIVHAEPAFKVDHRPFLDAIVVGDDRFCRSAAVIEGAVELIDSKDRKDSEDEHQEEDNVQESWD